MAEDHGVFAIMTVIGSCAIYQKHVGYKRLFMFYSCRITQCTGPTIRKHIAMKVPVTHCVSQMYLKIFTIEYH